MTIEVKVSTQNFYREPGRQRTVCHRNREIRYELDGNDGPDDTVDFLSPLSEEAQHWIRADANDEIRERKDVDLSRAEPPNESGCDEELA